MNSKDSSKLTQYHYLIDKHDDEKAFRKINKKLEKNNMDYRLESLNRGIALYKNTKDNSNVISVKGTNITNINDLISDAKLGLGFSSNDKQFKQRRNEIKRIYKTEEGDKYLIGHSLGGSIINSALVKSKGIRDNTKGAMTFNTGYTKLFHDELKKEMTPEIKKELKNKLTHYHTKDDIISHHLTKQHYGNLKTITTDNPNPLDKHSLTNYTGEKDEEL